LSRSRTAILAALAVAVLVAGITLAVSGTSDSSEPETAADARSRFVVAGDLTLTLARGWAPGGDEAAVQRLGLDEGAAFGPSGGDGSAGLLIGQDRSPAAGLVSEPLAELLGTQRPQAPKVVGLAAGDAVLHDSRGDGDDDAPRTLAYLLPNTRGLATAVCYARTPEALAQLRACTGMLSTLGIVGAETQAVAPDPQLQQALTSTIRDLNARRNRGAEDLRAKRTPAGQASAASRLRRAHDEAARAIFNTAAPPLAEPRRDALVESIEAVGAGYGALARAAQANDRAGYAAARRSVRQGEQDVAARLEDLRLLGYGTTDGSAAS
jgi:GH24 family phage-related lysozyme (muramidase)